MNNYKIIKKKNDSIIIAVLTLYNIGEVIKNVEKELLNYRFNGYYVFDFLLRCIDKDSIDRLVAYKVHNGKIDFNDKYLVIQDKNQVIQELDTFYKRLDKNIIRYSMLSNKDKSNYLIKQY